MKKNGIENAIYIQINKTSFEYDVNALVKAFYPGVNVRVITPESSQEPKTAPAGGDGSPRRAEEGAAVWQIEINDTGAALWCGEGPSDSRKYQWQRMPEETDISFKDGFKIFLYRTLQAETGKSLPWGNLTGIRPTKIAYGMLEQGKSFGEILDFMQKKHFVSEEKARLSVEIAQREMDLLAGLDQNPDRGYSLYIGIPFCPTTCLYCSFTSYPIALYRKRVEEYIDCLIEEMKYVAGQYRGRGPDTVYIGGGTPTTLEAGQLDRLLGALKELFDFGRVREFTVEAGRADSITKEKLDALYRHGVSRISVNPQTMKQETLDMIGRKAGVAQVREAYLLAREAGFDNINMDLILGLPGESEEDVQRTVDSVVELGPDSLTVHSLAIKRASKLNQWIQENGVSMLNNTDKTMKLAAAGARALGMEPYYLYRQKNMSGNFENVGYARPGKYGLYNILIMEEKQTIVACGAGSISKRVYPDGRIERSENLKEAALYMEKIEDMIERKKVLLEKEQ